MQQPEQADFGVEIDLVMINDAEMVELVTALAAVITTESEEESE